MLPFDGRPARRIGMRLCSVVRLQGIFGGHEVFRMLQAEVHRSLIRSAQRFVAQVHADASRRSVFVARIAIPDSRPHDGADTEELVEQTSR